jgi:S1-C subfamily serine protease
MSSILTIRLGARAQRRLVRLAGWALCCALLAPADVLAAASQAPSPEPARAPRAVAQASPASEDDEPLPGLELALQLESTYLALAERVFPSIVTVRAFERIPASETAAASSAPHPGWISPIDENYPGYRRIGSASGVILTADGDVLTNRESLLKADGKPADLVDVETIDNRLTICRVLGMEPTLNLAVLKLDVYSSDNPPRFRPIRMGNSFLLHPGSIVAAVADPLGPEKFFGVGVCAGTPNRECYQEQLSSTYVQTAMQVHPGSYGGALVNLRGEFVGMLAPRAHATGARAGELATHTGLEFALPSNIIQGLYGTIRRNQSFQSPWLGYAVMSMAELRKELGPQAAAALVRPPAGIYIENVYTPSPAAAADVRPGDFLTKFNGIEIHSPLDFQKQLYLAGIGTRVPIEFFRAGATYVRELVIEVRPPSATTR